MLPYLFPKTNSVTTYCRLTFTNHHLHVVKSLKFSQTLWNILVVRVSMQDNGTQHVLKLKTSDHTIHTHMVVASRDHRKSSHTVCGGCTVHCPCLTLKDGEVILYTCWVSVTGRLHLGTDNCTASLTPLSFLHNGFQWQTSCRNYWGWRLCM